MRLIINAKISPARKVNLHILDPLGAAQEFMVNRLETRGNWKPAKHAGKIGWEILGNDYPLKVILVLPFPSSFPAIFRRPGGKSLQGIRRVNQQLRCSLTVLGLLERKSPPRSINFSMWIDLGVSCFVWTSISSLGLSEHLSYITTLK